MNTNPISPTYGLYNDNADFMYCIFAEEFAPALSLNSPFHNSCMTLQLNAKHISSSIIHRDNQGRFITNFANHGTVSGLYWLWKNTAYSYVGFSLVNTVLDISQADLDNFLNANKDIYILKPRPCNCPLQENYRSLYYGYDFRMLLSILKKYAPAYYSFAKEKWLEKNDFFEPTCIIKRDLLNNFCTWLFPILEHCYKHIPPKHSKYQNRFLEHLTYYLFMLYISYHADNLTFSYAESTVALIQEPPYSIPPSSFENPKDYVQYLLNEGNTETALNYLNENNELSKIKILLPIFEQYERERRYYKTTLLDKTHNINTLLIQSQRIPQYKDCSPKVLIFEWNSITHKESIYAFEKLGFECHTFKTPYNSWTYDDDFLEQVNRHLDLHSFDMVFSVNYFAMVAEACYIHDIPYIAWCYDSPTYIGDLRYLNHPTNHVFLFDSAETADYHSRGCTNVYYMPLAVNVDRLNKISCTAEDINKYHSSISFVGALYDTNLTAAVNYLTDYQKAYINALVDNQLNLYGYDLYTNILNDNFMEWLSQPDFNKAIQSEWEKQKVSTDTPSAGSLAILLNKMVTNRERLLLITMLSKHWDFKLYSTGTNEVFNNVIQCGTVEYYQEMPKVFRNSRINLNVTFRSIRAGIPQRCLDIMGSHGLLLTNYQKDFEEYFKDQENLLIYHSIEEAYDKVKFYLEHETERKKIEDNGYETVCKYFNYPEVLKKILCISNLDNLLK